MKKTGLLLLFVLQACSPSGLESIFSTRVPTVIFVINARNAQSIDYVKLFFQHVTNMQNKPSIKVIFFRSKEIQFKASNISYEILDDKICAGLGLQADYFYLFDPKKKEKAGGPLFGDDGDLIQKIDEYFFSEAEETAKREEVVSATIDEIISIINIDKYLVRPFNCFAFYEEVCSGCESGQVLIEFDRLCKEYNECTFSYVPLSNYTEADARRICSNLNVHTKFIILDKNTLTWWDQQTEKNAGKHPFIGTLIVLDNNRVERYRTKNINELKQWLNRHISKQNRK